MTQKIHPETLAALADWRAGKPVKSIELGHSHRMKPATEPTAAPQIDLSVRHHRDQQRAHDFCFDVIGYFRMAGYLPEDHEHFSEVAEEIATQDVYSKDLTPEERVGAESRRHC